MNKKFKEDVEMKMGFLEEDLSELEKEKSFYEFLENSEHGKNISKLEGSYEHGFKISGRDYSLVDDFSLGIESANRNRSLFDDHAKLVGVLKFFNDKKFEEYGARYNLVEDNLSKEKMNVTYILNIDDGDYSGTPLSPFGPYFSFPKKLKEMEKFYLEKGMNKDLVSKIIGEVGIIRRGLGAKNF